MLFHIGVEERMAFRPKTRYMRVGLLHQMSRVQRVRDKKLDIRCLHQTINDWGSQTGRTHRGGQCNEDVDLLVELRMDREGGKGLGGPLAETNVAETPRLGGVENIGNGIRDVVPGKVIH